MRAPRNHLTPRAAIERMVPYRPPSSGRGGEMRLDFNENTVGCSPRVLRRLQSIAADNLAIYPEYQEALPKFAAYFGVRPAEMVLTNGTDEAIQLIVNTYVSAGDPVVALRPSYAMYRFYAQLVGAQVVEVDYSSDLSFPEKELRKKVTARTKAIFIANPDNPTGASASPAQLKALLTAAPRAAVLVDEAYFEFSRQTVLPWIKTYPNLFVSRTFSKAFGLAALRLGCLFSQAQNILAARKGQSPYSVNSVAVALGLEAIRDAGYMKRYADEVLRARKLLCRELEALGLKYFPSDANFVLVDFGAAADAMSRALGEQAILVRDRSYELPGCVRITVGTVAQMQMFLAALRRALAKPRRAMAKPHRASRTMAFFE